MFFFYFRVLVPSADKPEVRNSWEKKEFLEKKEEGEILPSSFNSHESIVADADIVAGRAEGIPRDVEPGGGGEQLVGMGVGAQEGHQ